MAHNVEPMDVDHIDSDFDNKENSFHHSNVLPCTEKGYEELDVSELNMKLRYSLTPASSPMSKSYTSCTDNRNIDLDDTLNGTNDNLTRSLNSTITKNDSIVKTLRPFPLKAIPAEQVDSNRNTSVLRQLDATIDNNNVIVTITPTIDSDENISLPSTSSSALHTPEATTPVNDLKADGGSPIMRGLKSVLSMFRSSTSPIPPDGDNNTIKQELTSTPEIKQVEKPHATSSTPIAANRSKDGSISKKNSPLKESIVFNDDLEKELHWKDETTIIFSEEKIPIHKLFNQNKPENATTVPKENKVNDNLNAMVEYMDISYNDSIVKETNDMKTDKESHVGTESDNEFVDCETTFTNNNTSQILDDVDQTVDIKELLVGTAPNVIPNNGTSCEVQEVGIQILNEQSNVDENASNNDDVVKPENVTLTLNVTSECKDEADSTISLINELDELIDNKSTKEEINQTFNEEQLKDPINIINTLTTDVPLENVEVISDKTHEINVTFDSTKVLNEEATLQNDQPVNIDDKGNIKNLLIDTKSNVITSDLKEKAPESETNNEVESFENADNLGINALNEEQTSVDMQENNANIGDKFDNDHIVTEMLNEVNKEIKSEPAEIPIENPADIPLPEDDEIEQELDRITDDIVKPESIQSIVTESVILESLECNKKDTDTLVATTIDTTSDVVFKNEINDFKITVNNTPALQSPMKETISQEELPTIIESSDNMPTMEHEVINKTSEPMDINKSISEINVLPDLVSQAVLPSTDHVEVVTHNVDDAQNIVTEIPKSIDDTTLTKEDLKPDTGIEENEIACEKEFKVDEGFEISEVNSASTFVIGEKFSNVTVTLDDNDTESMTNVEQPPSTNVEQQPEMSVDNFESNAINVVEEIVMSENNSPYVSLMTEIDQKSTNNEKLEEVKDPIVPSSPPIVSKGYNFNFDEIDDPFATKTKVRLSPPPFAPGKDPEVNDTITKPKEINRRKSQPPERKRPGINKKKLNSTFDSKSDRIDRNTVKNKANGAEEKPSLEVTIENETFTCDIMSVETEVLDIDKEVCEEVTPELLNDNAIMSNNKENNQTSELDTKVMQTSVENKSFIESHSSNEAKTTSDQSDYYSAGTSSIDSMAKSRNVFNLPEIDDINFNPFATKCKIKSSPDSSMLPSLENHDENQVVCHNVVNDKMDTELMEKETPANVSFVTTSSKTTDDKNLTQEVNTEDEDTEEGPFEFDDSHAASNDDMMKFNELPTHKIPNAKEDNEAGELFIDAEAFEFLLNQNQSNVVTDSGKESLFLKFDPLFAKRLSTSGALAALNKMRNAQNMPVDTKPDTIDAVFTGAGPSSMNLTFDGDANVSQESNDDLNVTVSKPTMIVTPAVNPSVTTRNKSVTPNRTNRRSVVSSPAMAVIDRLLSLSANNSPVAHDTTTVVRREQTEADLALVQLRELLAEKEIEVQNLRSESKELKDRLTTMESQVKALEADGQNRLKRINDLTNDLAEKTKINKSMSSVVAEYERTISSLIAAIEQDKKNHAEEKMKLIKERDEQTAHLSSMEVSFSDLHSKYEKSKQIILNCKANEETYKKSLKEFEESVTKIQKNYEMLKQHATSKLNQANQEFEKMTKAHESEILKLNTMIKRKDVHITSLEESLAQKIKANDELTAICDELINKVG